MENDKIYLVLAILILLSLITYNAAGDFSGFGEPTSPDWFNTTWNYRIRLDINSTGCDREDWPVEYRVNFTDKMPGTFNINSTRVFEYSESGLREVAFQFDSDEGFNASGNAAGTIVFLMNGTTQENETRIYYIYYDSIENGQKQAVNYSSNITYSGGEKINVNTTLFNFFIDTNRKENTSGLYRVSETVYENTMLNAAEGNRTAEYLEYSNGTANLSFNLIGNYSFSPNPVIRLTVTQIGDEILFGNPGQKTNESRVVKKYYIYDIGTINETGVSTFIKIEQQLINTANHTIQRNSALAGAPAFDVQRTLNANDYTSNTTDPYSWAKATRDGGIGTLGIISVNESGTSNFSAVTESGVGRIGINLSTTDIQENSSISQTSVVFFGPSSGFANDQFILIRKGFSNPLNITEYEPERRYVEIIPFIEPAIYNRNETVLIRVNLSSGDPYNLTRSVNATLNMGTADESDDQTLQLYDDGNITNGDQAAGDEIFTKSFDIPITANITEWAANFTVYGEDGLLNYTIGKFNVTNLLNVTVNVLNPTGMTNRLILAELYVMNYRSDSWIAGAYINCSYNGIEVANKTDHNNGTYSVNFTAPSSPGIFTLVCNATKNGNFGNGTDTFIAESAKISVALNVTPENVTLSNIELYANESFALNINASDIGYGIAYFSNFSAELPSGWSSQPNFYNCNNISINSSCATTFNVTAPNGTIPGNYTVNITVTWTNPDSTVYNNITAVNITVVPRLKISVTENKLSGEAGDGIESFIGNFTVFSIGNYALVNITFNCSGGTVCQYFNASFYPANITTLAMGSNSSVAVNVSVPIFYAPGTYNGTVNVSSNGVSDTFIIEVNVSANTSIAMVMSASNYTAYNLTLYDNGTLFIYTNATVSGKGSARYVNITLELPSSWYSEPLVGYCPNMTHGGNCTVYFNITIPNATLAENYYANATVRWINPDNSTSLNRELFNITVAPNPKINISVGELYANASMGNTTNVGNFTVFSLGNYALQNITFTCAGGSVCQDFNTSFYPANITTLAMGSNSSVDVNVSVPSGYLAGNYNWTVNVTSNGGIRQLVLFITVLPSMLWNMTPTSCDRSEYPDEGTVCEVVVRNLGNAAINFTITPESGNYTRVNVTNFTVAAGLNYTFSVTYNITGADQKIYNFTYLVQAIQEAVPQEINLSIKLIPYLPPLIDIRVLPNITVQNGVVEIFANLTDRSSAGISWVKINITVPNGTANQFNMTLISQNNNITEWYAMYPNQTGNTSENGIYTILVYSEDTIGNFGNFTSSFKIYKKLAITSATLSSQYYQGDTGSIFYAARGINGSGVERVNVTFTIMDSAGNISYAENWQTNAEGLIYPMPGFTIASDSPIGNYTLTTISVYNDTAANVSVRSESNSTFGVKSRTVTVTGLFADLETAVVWYPDNIMRFGIMAYDGEGKPVNATSMNLTVNDPAGSVYFSRALMTGGTLNPILNVTQKATGFYVYNHAMASDTPTGMFLAVLNVEQNTFQTMKMKAFRVARGGPYDVRMELSENEAEQNNYLNFIMVVENKGEVSQDVTIEYWVSSEVNTYYSSSEAVYTPANTNQSFTRSVFIYRNQTPGTYVLNARVTYDNVQAPITINKTFSVVSAVPRVTTTTVPASEGGGGIIITPSLVDRYPSQQAGIIIERYNNNISLSLGMTRIEYVTIRNIGVTILSNISLFVLGIPLEWYNITPAGVDMLRSGNSSVFLVEFHIPRDAKTGDYKINLLTIAGGESDQRLAVITVFESIKDVIVNEIKKLRADLDKLNFDIRIAENEGQDVSKIKIFADEIGKEINNAEENLKNNDTDLALNNMGTARKLLEETYGILNQMKVFIVPQFAALSLLFIFIIIILVIIVVILVILWRKKKLPVLRPHIKHIEKLISGMRSKGVSDEILKADKEKLVRMLSVLEDEKKDGIVNENAYIEMKSSIEGKLSKIEKHINKEKG